MSETNASKPTDAEVVAWLDEHCEHGWSCIKIDGDWRASGSVGGRPHTSLRDEPRNARAGLARALGMGAAPPRPVCPLPQVGEWRWWGAVSKRSEWWECSLNRLSFGYEWFVAEGDNTVSYGITRTRRGAMRAAERAARKAWAVRNG